MTQCITQGGEVSREFKYVYSHRERGEGVSGCCKVSHVTQCIWHEGGGRNSFSLNVCIIAYQAGQKCWNVTRISRFIRLDVWQNCVCVFSLARLCTGMILYGFAWFSKPWGDSDLRACSDWKTHGFPHTKFDETHVSNFTDNLRTFAWTPKKQEHTMLAYKKLGILRSVPIGKKIHRDLSLRGLNSDIRRHLQ